MGWSIYTILFYRFRFFYIDLLIVKWSSFCRRLLKDIRGKIFYNEILCSDLKLLIWLGGVWDLFLEILLCKFMKFEFRLLYIFIFGLVYIEFLINFVIIEIIDYFDFL